MKYLLLFAFLFLYSGYRLNAQVQNDDSPEIFQFVEEMPAFPGGMDSLNKFLRNNIQYPTTAIEDTVQGKVLVQFVVASDGKIKEPKVIKSVRDDLDKEALRVVNMMPPWLPGKQNGRNVNVRFVIPVIFRLR
jgi:protein TonB